MVTDLIQNNEILFFVLFLISLFVGYILCHFIIAPILLSKHGKKGLLEAMMWEALQAENHLRELATETNDKAVYATLKVIKYSKYFMAIFFALYIASMIISI
jgi:hypothetical protein